MASYMLWVVFIGFVYALPISTKHENGNVSVNVTTFIYFTRYRTLAMPCSWLNTSNLDFDRFCQKIINFFTYFGNDVIAMLLPCLVPYFFGCLFNNTHLFPKKNFL